MDDNSLLAIIKNATANSSNDYGAHNAWKSARLKAERYYKGEQRGDEIEGRSQVVSRDVAETVDSIMPVLMRIFSSGDKVVEFQANEPEDEESAKQATDYVNWIWNVQNEGFRVFHDWFKDGLLHRLGIIKIWWDETPTKTVENYRGLKREEIDIIAADPDVDIVKEEEVEGYTDVAYKQESDRIYAELSQQGNQQLAQTGAVDPQLVQAIQLAQQELSAPPVPLFNVRVERKIGKGRIRIMPVPPEEFIISDSAKGLDLDSFKFAAHRRERTVSDLIDEGYDDELVNSIGGGSTELTFAEERIERHRDENYNPFGRSTDVYDKSLRVVVVDECYIKVDYDGDGIAELRKITVAGNTILENIEIDDHPFAVVTPKPAQHKLIGRSIADELIDLQDIKTTLWRQMLDNVYIANNNRLIVDETNVNMDDLLTARPGGIVRARSPNAVQPLPFQNIVPDVYQIMQYTDEIRENRVGVTKYNQGIDADSLNKTASGVTQIMDAGRQRIELIARVYAEGVAIAFKKVLKCVCQYQDYEKVIRLRGKYAPMDPRGWSSGYDAVVAVGLGTGNRDQQIGRMLQLIELDLNLLKPEVQAATGDKLVSAKNIYNKLVKIIEASGLKSAEPYYTDPEGDEALAARAEAEAQAAQLAQAQGAGAAPQGDPLADQQQALALEVQAVQAKAQSDIEIAQARAQNDLQIAQVRAQNELQIQREKAAVELQIEQIKAQNDLANVQKKYEYELQIQLAKTQSQLTADEIRAKAKADSDALAAAVKADRATATQVQQPIVIDDDVV